MKIEREDKFISSVRHKPLESRLGEKGKEKQKGGVVCVWVGGLVGGWVGGIMVLSFHEKRCF